MRTDEDATVADEPIPEAEEPPRYTLEEFEEKIVSALKAVASLNATDWQDLERISPKHRGVLIALARLTESELRVVFRLLEGLRDGATLLDKFSDGDPEKRWKAVWGEAAARYETVLGWLSAQAD
jgi:hypothetical protein